MSVRDHTKWRFPAFAAIYVLWGGAYLAIRFVVEVIPPFLAAGIRYSLSAVILILISLFALRSPRPSRRQFLNCTVSGMMMFVFGYSAVYWAETRLASWVVAVLTSSGFMWTYIAECLVLGTDRLRASTLVPLVCGLAGMVFLISSPLELKHAGSGIAAIVVLASVISWSSMTIVLKRVELPSCYMQTAGLQLAGAAAALLPLSYALGEWREFPDASHVFRAAPVLAMTYLVVGGSVIALTSFHWLLAHETPSLVATSTYVNPIVAMVAGIVLTNEPWSARQLWAASAVLLSVILVWRSKSTPKLSDDLLLAAEGASR
jgi:drug/metabolite transporter (DMT)-like permease